MLTAAAAGLTPGEWDFCCVFDGVSETSGLGCWPCQAQSFPVSVHALQSALEFGLWWSLIIHADPAAVSRQYQVLNSKARLSATQNRSGTTIRG